VRGSKEVSLERKQALKRIYQSLNPAELKRTIDKKLDLLYKAYQKKNRSQKVEPQKKLKPISVRNYIAQPEPISVRYLNCLTRFSQNINLEKKYKKTALMINSVFLWPCFASSKFFWKKIQVGI